MTIRKPNECIKAMCGGACAIIDMEKMKAIYKTPQDCPYYRYKPSIYIVDKNNSQKRVN